MFCAKCGAVLPDNAEKCDQCGARVRIRPDQSGRKKIGGKTGSSRSDESALRSEKNAEKAIQEESLMDPVFFEEAGKDVDVQAIIKIAHGEDPYKTEKAEEDKRDAVKKDYSFSRSVSRKSEAGEDEKGDPELNMESYLESLPLIEKIRRKIKEYHHKRAESADEKRMKKHLERASKHFSEVESEDLKAEERRLQKEAARRREEKLRAEKAEAEKLRAQKAEAEKLRAQKAEAEKLLSEKAEAEKLRAEKEEAERAAKEALLKKEKAPALSSSQADGEGSDSGRQGEDKPAAEKAEADLAEAARLQEEAIRRHQEEKRAERIAAAARQRERARAGAVRRQDEQQPQSPAPQDREGLEVIRLHGRDQSEEARVREEENAVEAALLQEAERAAEAARIQQEEEARIHAAQRDQSVRQREERDDRIQKILNTGSEEYDSFRPISEHNRKELSKEGLQLEKLRRQRKYRNNQPDRLDEFLGKYGLTKETAVRIATLFLIVVLSVIYVLGRGSSKTAPDHTGAGTGTTGIESVEEQVDDGTVTEPSEDSEETQLPTGGGDFENN